MRLPPLDTLRAFDAAYAHGSFTRAGEALNVTHGAVSRQVAQLERHLGLPLFRRGARGLEPTAAGIRFHGVVKRALNEIGQVAGALREEAKGGSRAVVRVTTTPSFGARWLMPRLHSFHAAHPGIQIQVEADTRVVDIGAAGLDLAIRFGDGHWAGTRSRLLMAEQHFPVCAPGLLGGRTLDVDTLRRVTLLHDGDRPLWRRWLQAAGLPEEFGAGGLVFNDYNLLIEAAANGHGIGLGRSVLVEAELRSGRLVAPSPVVIDSDWKHYLVAPGPIERPAVRAFADWILKAGSTELPEPARVRMAPHSGSVEHRP